MDQELCWKAVVERDARCDGRFYFGVVTTGVYCRPSCPARQPLRKNVRFFATATEAEAAGLRPCLRCRPLETGAEVIPALCRFIEQHCDEPLPLDVLAAQVNLSASHMQKLFRRATGVTPRQYQETFRLQRLKDGLRSAGDVTAAVYDAGYGSASRVYENASGRLGMTPGQYRRGGEGVEISYLSANSEAGLVMVGATDRGLCFVQFANSEPELLEQLRREYPAATLLPAGAGAPVQAWIADVVAHLAGAHRDLQLPIDIRATAFQMRVWEYLRTIPYGSVQSYSEVAAGIGQPKAARAVARACASNTVALVIPCHRVIRGTGDLGGYRWGMARKRVLLDRERATYTSRR